MFLGLLKHVAYARRADTNEHLYEIGAGYRKERHLGFSGNGARQQRLAGAGRANHQHTAWNTAAEFLKLARIAQKIDQFGHLLLGLLAARDVRKSDGIGGFIKHARPALAERKCATAPATLHLAHEEYPYADEQQHRKPRHEDIHQQGGLFVGLGLDYHTSLQQIRYHPRVRGRIGREFRTVALYAFQYPAFNRDFGDVSLLHLVDKLRVLHRS